MKNVQKHNNLNLNNFDIQSDEFVEYNIKRTFFCSLSLAELTTDTSVWSLGFFKEDELNVRGRINELFSNLLFSSVSSVCSNSSTTVNDNHMNLYIQLFQNIYTYDKFENAKCNWNVYPFFKKYQSRSWKKWNENTGDKRKLK